MAIDTANVTVSTAQPFERASATRHSAARFEENAANVYLADLVAGSYVTMRAALTRNADLVSPGATLDSIDWGACATPTEVQPCLPDRRNDEATMTLTEAYEALANGQRLEYVAANGNCYRLRLDSDVEAGGVWCDCLNNGRSCLPPDMPHLHSSPRSALIWAETIAPLSKWQAT